MTFREDIWLICNPKSGSGKAEKLFTEAAELIPGAQVRLIEEPGDGTQLALQAVQQGAKRVITAGGDGTLNAVARGLVGTSVPMGVVPMGSGNGYARSIGIPKDPERALALAIDGPPRRMDVGYLNDQLFLGTAGIGFDARVAEAFDKSARRGAGTYAKIIMQEVFRAEPMHVKISTSVQHLEDDVLFVCFANTREFGNGAIISPRSRPDDGMAEVQMVRKPSLFALPNAIYQMYTGRAEDSPFIDTLDTVQAQVEQAGKLAHLDGEPFQIGGTFRFRLDPGRLLVVAPDHVD